MRPFLFARGAASFHHGHLVLALYMVAALEQGDQRHRQDGRPGFVGVGHVDAFDRLVAGGPGAIVRPQADGDRLPRTDKPVFLYVGRLAVEKSVEDFLSLDLPGEKWVAGEGPSAAALRRRYPEARWFGLLSGDDLARIYRSASVMVFPSHTDTFGLVMIESMACGTPVAAFPVTGPIDVLGDGPGGVMHTDLRQACLQALKLDRKQVARYAQKFSWAAATRQFLGAVRPVTDSRTVSALPQPRLAGTRND